MARPAVFEEQGLPVFKIHANNILSTVRIPSELERKLMRRYRDGDLNLLRPLPLVGESRHRLVVLALSS